MISAVRHAYKDYSRATSRLAELEQADDPRLWRPPYAISRRHAEVQAALLVLNTGSTLIRVARDDQPALVPLVEAHLATLDRYLEGQPWTPRQLDVDEAGRRG